MELYGVYKDSLGSSQFSHKVLPEWLDLGLPIRRVWTGLHEITEERPTDKVLMGKDIYDKYRSLANYKSMVSGAYLIDWIELPVETKAAWSAVAARIVFREGFKGPSY